MRTRVWFSILLLLSGAAAQAHEAEPPTGHELLTGLDQRIALELVGADATDVFESFAAIVEAEADLDPRLEGQVTIQLKNVSQRTTLDALCEMLDCRWWIEEGPPRRLRVKAHAGSLSRAKGAKGEGPGTLDTRLTLSLTDAPAEEVLRSFARIGRWKLEMEQPKLTIELDDVVMREALDIVCDAIECAWTLEEVDGEGVLRVEWLD